MTLLDRWMRAAMWRLVDKLFTFEGDRALYRFNGSDGRITSELLRDLIEEALG